MKQEIISQALNNLSDRHISETASFSRSTRRAAPKRVLANRESAFPEQAAVIIQAQDESAQTADWAATIAETYCDENTLIIATRITCNDRFLLVPTDAEERDPASVDGFTGDGSLADYAAEKGKSILLMNLGVSDERIGVISASIHFETVSDSELLILYNANKSQPFDTLETTCEVIAQPTGTEELERLSIPLSLTAGSTKTLGIYTPVNSDAVPGIHAGQAQLFETPLGLSIQYPVEITDPTASNEIMFFSCEEIDFRGTGALGFTAEDGTEYARLTMGAGEAQDRLTIRYYDWDKQPIGEILFIK